MRSLNLHLKVLITLLVALGVLITAYQIFILGIPVTEDETDDLWNIDARVEFQATPREPVKLQMFVPPLNQDYVSLNESFIPTTMVSASTVSMATAASPGRLAAPTANRRSITVWC